MFSSCEKIAKGCGYLVRLPVDQRAVKRSGYDHNKLYSVSGFVDGREHGKRY
jgi:hypothetical protein